MANDLVSNKISRTRIWYMLAAVLIGLVFALQVIGPILHDDTIVQDDFRQTYFWFWRFWDPNLFRDDLFAKAYQNAFTLNPAYTWFWSTIAPRLSNNLIYVSKLYVIFLGIVSSLSAFLFFNSLTAEKKKLLSLAFTVAMTTTFWCTDHLSAAHVRSSIWLALFSYMWLKQINKNTLASLLCTFLLFFNPTAFVLCMGMEMFVWIIHDKWSLKSKRFLFLVINSLITISYHFVFLKGLKYSGDGEQFTPAELRLLPELNPGGRHPIFGSSLWDGSWWTNEHWGFGIGFLPISKIIFVAIFLLVLYLIIARPNKSLVLSLSRSYPMILVYSSSFFFFLSQFVYPLLYLPSRYISITSLIISMILTFICFDLLSEKLFNQVPTSNKVSRSEQRRLKKTKSSDTKIFEQKGLVINALVIIMALGIWVYFKDSYYTRFVKINPQVKDIVSKLPPDSLIAGHPLLPDLNTISITTKRKVFVDYERSLAYTKLTLYEIRRRNEVALKLTYAKSKDEFLQLARADGITHYLAFIGFYSPQYLSNPIYIEPYNQLSLNLVKLKPNESFFIEDVLHSKHQDYMLISLDDLK